MGHLAETSEATFSTKVEKKRRFTLYHSQMPLCNSTCGIATGLSVEFARPGKDKAQMYFIARNFQGRELREISLFCAYM